MSESAIEAMADWLEKAIEQTHGYRSTNRAKYVELAKLLPAAVGAALAEDDAAVERIALHMFKDSWERSGNVAGPARERAWAYSSGEWLQIARAAIRALGE